MIAQTRKKLRELVGDDRGATHVTFALMFPLLGYGFVGLAYDGGGAVNTRASADNVAQSAARAAVAAVVQSPDGGAELDPGAAVQAGLAVIAEHDDMSGSVSVSGPNEVTVVLQASYSPVIFIGPDWNFDSQYVAEAQVGVIDNDDSGGAFG